jgi:predicted DNA binding CopG/RHH family protein
MGNDLPDFKSQKEELEFWDKTDVFGCSEPDDIKVTIDPSLQKTMRPITIRLRSSQIDALKALAEKKEMRYQTMVRGWIAERIRQEITK